MMQSFGYMFNRFIEKPLSLEEESGESAYLEHQDLEHKDYEDRLKREFEENKLIIAQLEKQLFELLQGKPTRSPYKSKEDKRAARIARRAARGGQQYCERRFVGFV